MNETNENVESKELENYRSRIFRYYTSTRQTQLVPETIEGLKPRAPALKKIIKQHFPENRDINILDLGCGHGAFIYFMREAGYKNTVGIDRSPAQVEEAARLGIDGVKVGDIMDTLKTTPGGTQDLVICYDALQQFTRPELFPIVDEIYRVLKKGGKFIIHTINGESPFCSRQRYWDLTQEIAFTRQSITQLLKSSSFSEVICQEERPIPHGLKSFVRAILWYFIRAIWKMILTIETGGSGGKNCILSQWTIDSTQRSFLGYIN